MTFKFQLQLHLCWKNVFEGERGHTEFLSLIQNLNKKKLSKWKIVHILIKLKLLTDYREYSEIFNSEKQPVSLLDSGV